MGEGDRMGEGGVFWGTVTQGGARSSLTLRLVSETPFGVSGVALGRRTDRGRTDVSDGTNGSNGTNGTMSGGRESRKDYL
jgi:hypothetical protein